MINYDAFKEKTAKKRSSLLDDYERVIDEQLELYPKLPATRLIQILQDRGYKGSISLLRLYLSRNRQRHLKPYMKMKVLPGEQGQVDWAHCGALKVGKAERKLYLFVMVLSYSRAIFAKFCLNQNTATFLRCHEDAFKYFQGIPRIILYDNLKSVVLERFSPKVQFNPQVIEFSGFYCFEPRPCNVYRGNEKDKLFQIISTMVKQIIFNKALSTTFPKQKSYLRDYLIRVISYLSFDNRSADLLFEIVSKRYEQGSIIITTNLSFKDWGKLFQGAACVTALIDRLTHYCEVTKITADSFRAKESLEKKGINNAKNYSRKKSRSTSDKAKTNN